MATKKLTYDQIVARIRDLWMGSVERNMETGRLVDQALVMGKTIADLAVDTGIGTGRLTRYRRTAVFWGADRIPDCVTWDHYERVAAAGDNPLKARLIREGDRLCVKSTVDASGRTKNHREKVAAAETAINTAIVILSAMKTPLAAQQSDVLSIRIKALEDLVQQRTERLMPGTAVVTPVRESGYQISPVRAWARAHGFPIGNKGRIATHIIAAYQAAH